MTTPTDAVCVSYYGTYDPGQPEDHLTVNLFGAKRWYEDGWVYRLEGEVVVAGENDPRPSLYYYDDILVYMIQGKIFSASESAFVDVTGAHTYTWEDLEYVINTYESEGDEDVDSITEEECLYAMQLLEELSDDGEGEDEEDLFSY